MLGVWKIKLNKMTKKKNTKIATAAPAAPAITDPTVITYDGIAAPKSICRRIGDNYYTIGSLDKKDSGQVYELGGVWYRVNNGKVVWDYENEIYVLTSTPNLVSGIVDVVNGAPVYGSFTANVYKNINCSQWGIDNFVAISEDVAMKLPRAVRDVQQGRITWSTNKNIAGLQHPGLHNKSKYNNFDTSIYGFSGNPGADMSSDLFTDYVDSGQFTIEPLVKALAPYMKDYTFGAEFETCLGTVPENELFKLGLVPVKDGSISGHEYITIVHKGEVGLQAIINSADTLSNWTEVNQGCSLHFHVGNVPRTREFIISMYMLSYMLQHELHEVVAPYKKDVHYLANKNQGAKDHCKYLSSLGLFNNNIYNVPDTQRKGEIDSSFERIFTWLNDGNPSTKQYNFETRLHVRHERPKWEWLSRYYWINFCNMVFGNSGTVENRLHSGTVNSTKTVNWLLITLAMVDFAINNQEQIIRGKTKYSLSDIIDAYFKGSDNGDVIAKYLNDYILNRKQNYFHLQMKGDMYGDEFVNSTTGFQDIRTLTKKLK